MMPTCRRQRLERERSGALETSLEHLDQSIPEADTTFVHNFFFFLLEPVRYLGFLSGLKPRFSRSDCPFNQHDKVSHPELMEPESKSFYFTYEETETREVK